MATRERKELKTHTAEISLRPLCSFVANLCCTYPEYAVADPQIKIQNSQFKIRPPIVAA